jgi:hypothetical protein
MTPEAALPLPDLAADQGFAAMDEALKAMVAAANSPKKLKKALDTSQLAEVSMPVRLAMGAQLTLSDPSALGGCSWDGEKATCRLDAATSGLASAADFEIGCKFGGALTLTSTAADAPAGRIGWTVTDIEACWAVDGSAIIIRPHALGDLEGVGQGDEFIPPELVQLSQTEVEQTLKEHEAGFAYCTRKFAENGERARGKMILRYTIADDGKVGATMESGTFTDPRVEQCIIERFDRITFPPPQGGFTGGTWPVTFL